MSPSPPVLPSPSFPPSPSSMTIFSNNRQMKKYHHHNPRRRNTNTNKRFCRLKVVLGVVGIVATMVTFWSIRTSITILVPTATTGPNHNHNHNINNIPGFHHDNRHDDNRQRNRTRAVFYNIYVPPPPPPLPPTLSTTRNLTSTTADENDGAVATVENALEIIKEQLLFIQSSELLKSSTIYYTLIGTKNFPKTSVEKRDPNRSPSSTTPTTPPVVAVVSSSVDDEIQAICHDNGLNCVQSQSISKGSETVTLQSMWEYCTNEISSGSSSINNNNNNDHKDDDRLVTYIHSKGSFHPSTLNDNFRIMAMAAVMSDECQSIPIKPQQQQQQRSCNVCTGRFVPFPHFHPTGNFFVATCDYIKKLIPPQEFEQRMEEMMQYVLFGGQQQQQQHRHEHQSQTIHSQARSTPVIPKPTFQQYHNGWTVGTERFANEHWVSSYLPTFDPCDVVPLQQYRVGYKNLPKAIKPFTEKHKLEEEEEEELHRTHQPPKRNEQLWTPSLVAAPRFDLKTFMKRTTDRGSWFCGQARLFEYTYLYRQYYRSRATTAGSSSNSTSISNNNIIIHPPPVSAKSFIWGYYHEAFKGCPEPLNYTKHSSLFMELDQKQ